MAGRSLAGSAAGRPRGGFGSATRAEASGWSSAGDPWSSGIPRLRVVPDAAARPAKTAVVPGPRSGRHGQAAGHVERFRVTASKEQVRSRDHAPVETRGRLANVAPSDNRITNEGIVWEKPPSDEGVSGRSIPPASSFFPQLCPLRRSSPQGRASPRLPQAGVAGAGTVESALSGGSHPQAQPGIRSGRTRTQRHALLR